MAKFLIVLVALAMASAILYHVNADQSADAPEKKTKETPAKEKGLSPVDVAVEATKEVAGIAAETGSGVFGHVANGIGSLTGTLRRTASKAFDSVSGHNTRSKGKPLEYPNGLEDIKGKQNKQKNNKKAESGAESKASEPKAESKSTKPEAESKSAEPEAESESAEPEAESKSTEAKAEAKSESAEAEKPAAEQ